MPIKIYKNFSGDPRKVIEREAATAELAKRMGARGDDTPHGMTPEQIEALSAKGGQMLGSVYSPKLYKKGAIQELLPEGSYVQPSFSKQGQIFPGSPTTMPFGGIGGNTFITPQRPYQPEFDDMTKQWFPVHRRLANDTWTLFYKMDPVIGSVIDLFAELIWSNFNITGEGVDGEVKEALDYACRETKIRSRLPEFIKSFFVLGEVFPHLYWDNTKGVWTHIALHNPNQINVVHSPFIKMTPVLEFVPDQKLKELVNSNHPMLSRIRETMPRELVQALQTNQNIPLSPVNCSFIARKLMDYDIRGTSIIARLWRTLAYEDSLWNASIATARRAASPLKICKLGDPTTGTIPSAEEEKKVLGLLAQAELDPQAWLCYNYMLSTELAGAPERVMNINQHYELIERLKLSAMGVSKAFLSGDTSYASAASGLTIFLQRAKSLRDFFVSEWLMPKFFLPMAVANKWIKPSKAQAAQGQLRIKRSSKELFEENMYIVPTLEWEKSLDPTVDNERIQAMTALEQQLGIKVSDQKKYSSIGLDAEEEQKQIIEEIKFKRDLAGEDPQLQAAIGLTMPTTEGGSAGGGMGGILSPGIPPESFGLPSEEGGGLGGGGEVPGGEMGGGGAPPAETAPSPEGASKEGDKGAKTKPPTKDMHESKYWDKSIMQPLLRVLETFDPEELYDREPWHYALKDKDVAKALKSEDAHQLWEAVEQWLIDEGYTSEALNDLKATLERNGFMRKSSVNGVPNMNELTLDEDVNFLIGAR